MIELILPIVLDSSIFDFLFEDYGSEIPLLALLAECLALIVYCYLSIRLGTRWRHHRRDATRNLFLSFFFYFLAIIFLFSTKSTDFLTQDRYNVSNLGINLGYAFSLVGNVFLFYFTEDIFFDEESEIPYLKEGITFANGVTFGFLLLFIVQIQELPFLEIPGVYIPPHLLIWHVIISTIGFLILLIKAFQSTLNATTKLQKAGFFSIGLAAIFEILVFVFFFADRFLGGGFTIWYFNAWLSASIAGFCSMVGYLMPNWFRRIFNRK
jgi:hypothetical protein